MDQPVADRPHFVTGNTCLAGDRFPISITLIGVGGTGSHFAEGLARMHWALKQLGHKGLKVFLFDDDAFESHNIGRQGMAWKDIGTNKAHAVSERLNRMYETDFYANPFRFKVPKNSSMGNIVVTAVDNGKTRNEVQRAFRAKKPDQWSAHRDTVSTHYWLDMGNDDRFGQITLGSGNSKTCVEMFGKYSEEPARNSCSMEESLRSQDLLINQTMATIGLSMLWDLIRRGRCDKNAVFVNLANLSMRSSFNDYVKRTKKKP